ncbi:MAG: sulfatase-like hydrolase/transferase, partial [Candidatus Lokiarchaeota archaeon]|nr:sulfatase-like hydrolase/transferase [Candidatus Lokiarchaeota archaeon]
MSEKMNVLFIITDQQRADMLHCYGNDVIKTPNIDKLASESIRFSNA